MKSEYCSFKSLVSPYDLKKPIDWDQQFSRRAPMDVEIGFGMGEVLMRMARKSPRRNFVGIEQHWERICKTLRAMTKEQVADPAIFRNIRVLRVDARVVFERLFAPRSIDAIYCLFPCPWPKKGHVKNRLFANDFLRLLNKFYRVLTTPVSRAILDKKKQFNLDQQDLLNKENIPFFLAMILTLQKIKDRLNVLEEAVHKMGEELEDE